MPGHPNPLPVHEDVTGVDQGFSLTAGEIQVGSQDILEGFTGIFRPEAERLKFRGHIDPLAS